jgi:glycerophosphoryl diester phosphodiesterase
LASFVLGILGNEEQPPDSRFHVLDMPADYEGTPVVTPEVIRAAHRYGLRVFVWTIDDEVQMASLLKMGVDGIMTDRPDVLRRVLG